MNFVTVLLLCQEIIVIVVTTNVERSSFSYLEVRD